MRRTVILALSVALIVLVFAPIAAAQTNYGGGGNQGMNSAGLGSGGMNGMGMDHNIMGMAHNMMASPASSAFASMMPSASANTSATPTASPSASASASATGSATAAPSHGLPHTGGIPLVPLLSVGALVLLAGSGVFTARLMR